MIVLQLFVFVLVLQKVVLKVMTAQVILLAVIISIMESHYHPLFPNPFYLILEVL